jgi:hypothetical protein
MTCTGRGLCVAVVCVIVIAILAAIVLSLNYSLTHWF